jgi:O-6-methylguanine DNA methyltransferase
MRHAADNVGTTILETRWGYLGLTLSERGIVALELPHPDRALMARRLQAAWPGASPVAPEELAELSETLERYFDGEPVVFRESLDLRPWTPFQRRVWLAVATIPYGQTRSYAWVAAQINLPRAYRAVGQALGANPIPILIPGHRVRASRGDLHAPAGGLDYRRYLLALERGERPLFPPAILEAERGREADDRP